MKRFNNDDLHHEKFERNRITKVLKITKAKEWQYVPTDKNLADLASRGFLPDDEEEWKRWLGVDFFNLKESEWPVGEEVDVHPVGCARTSVQEDENEELFVHPQEHFLDALGERVSGWSKLVRIIA
jgi:hypothetical protein